MSKINWIWYNVVNDIQELDVNEEMMVTKVVMYGNFT